MSWSTNASRSAGVQRLEHDEEREADRVGEERLLLGIVADPRLTIGSGTCTSSGSSRRVVARPQHVQAHRRDDRGEPAAEVLDAVGARRGSGGSRPPAPRRRPRSASRASGRRQHAGGCGAPRTARPASRLAHRSHSSCGGSTALTDEANGCDGGNDMSTTESRPRQPGTAARRQLRGRRPQRARIGQPAMVVPGAMEALQAWAPRDRSERPAATHHRPREPAGQPDQRLRRVPPRRRPRREEAR